MKYRIDDLGWHSFERLVQALLKTQIGIGIENWSGPLDRGRDAYCSDDLPFPARDALSKGPFVFQVKFVAGANAAGAKPFGALQTAVQREAEAITQRVRAGDWETPAQYVLLTNTPLTSKRRQALGEILVQAIPDAQVHTLGATDICDMLDTSPSIRRSHPEVLGLGDLRQLIREAVGSAVLERSAAALQEAEELSRVFVATQAYEEALAILARSNFVVLDGPPEMGKTAIARMAALTRVFDGWTAIECRSPDDFFEAYERERRQVFVADDALGRTEYDITLGRQWERDLARVLSRVDPSHWLVWTTRRHILARAMTDLDFAGPARTFPEPGELVVDAARLTSEEKALILYRHAKGAGLPERQRGIIRQLANEIIKTKFFTPERIRRLVQEALSEILQEAEPEPLSGDALAALVEDSIKSPTTRMRRAFGGLSEPHHSILVNMLECSSYCSRGELLESYRRREGNVTEESFGKAVEDLTGTFLRTRYAGSLDWIHPSYRDVVIDEVSEDAETQVKFVRTATAQGLALALSTEGGEAGERQMPFMKCAGSWKAASDRLSELACSKDLAKAVDILRNAVVDSRSATEVSAHVDEMLSAVLDALEPFIQDAPELSTEEVEALRNMYSLDHVREPGFTLSGHFMSLLTRVGEHLESHGEISSRLVEEVFALVNWVQRFEPYTIHAVETMEKLDPIIEVLYDYASSIMAAEIDDDADYYDYEEEIRECERLAAAFDTLNYGDIERADYTAHELSGKVGEYYYELRRDEDDDEEEPSDPVEADQFEVERLFADL